MTKDREGTNAAQGSAERYRRGERRKCGRNAASRRAGRDQDRRVPVADRGFQTVARQALAGAKLYMQLNGDKVAGKKIELIVREDSGVPDVARRVVQEMIVNDKVNIVLGGITPTALAIGQLVTQAKIPTVVIISGASITV